MYMCYKDITFLEYQKKKLEMVNELGRKEGMCIGVNCSDCPLYTLLRGNGCNNCSALELLYPEETLKAVMQYHETDWTKVPVDTKILVKDFEEDEWDKRHFAKYENGEVYAYCDGNTSFTTDRMSAWDFAKLYNEK